MASEKRKEYSNGELTVVWKPEKCIHSAVCVKMLPEVYDPKAKPWINPDNATTSALREQIDRCPSGALSYEMNDGAMNSEKNEGSPTAVSAALIENGPLLMTGEFKLKSPNGKEESRTGTTAFCRCGASQNKPFCDGSHTDSGFEG